MSLLLYTAAVQAHSRFSCPPARSSDTGVKSGPCGLQFGDFSGVPMSVSPGPFTVVFEESVSHTGSPWRFSLSGDGDDSTACIILDHVPHDDSSQPSINVESTYTIYHITIEIPDVNCQSCSLHLSNPMTDKIGADGAPGGSGCTDPGSCFSVYHSCTTPLRITGSVPRADYSCPTAPPADWPQQWRSPDGGTVVADAYNLYRRESATWSNGWLVDAPAKFRDTAAGACVATGNAQGVTVPVRPPPSPPPTTLPACSANRPGWPTHRLLELPPAMVASSSQTEATHLARRLCCVYTWVVTGPSSLATAEMTTYDGGRRAYPLATTLVAAAQAAYDDICSMSMGSQDCSSQQACVLGTLDGLAPAPPPPLPPPQVRPPTSAMCWCTLASACSALCVPPQRMPFGSAHNIPHSVSLPCN